jgi:hypothetical protein
MNHKPGTTVPKTGIYWCTVCMSPQSFAAGDQFPECKNLCGRGLWKKADEAAEKQPPRG